MPRQWAFVFFVCYLSSFFSKQPFQEPVLWILLIQTIFKFLFKPTFKYCKVPEKSKCRRRQTSKCLKIVIKQQPKSKALCLGCLVSLKHFFVSKGAHLQTLPLSHSSGCLSLPSMWGSWLGFQDLLGVGAVSINYRSGSTQPPCCNLVVKQKIQ